MNLINNELFKLHMKKRLFPFFILNFFADVMLISFVLIKKDSIFYSLINGQNFPLFSLEITTVFSIIFSCMSVYDLFIYEDKSGTLCNELLTPLKRKEVVFSKFNAIMIELGVFFCGQPDIFVYNIFCFSAIRRCILILWCFFTFQRRTVQNNCVIYSYLISAFRSNQFCNTSIFFDFQKN